jgi:glutaredoxin-like protein NrdH
LKVTVYTLPVCVQCNQTKKLMDREGIEYDVVDLTEAPHQAAKFKEDGLLQAPIVVVGNDGRRWGGFRPDLIKELKPVAAVEGQ